MTQVEITAQELRAIRDAIVSVLVSEGHRRIEFVASDNLLKVYDRDVLIEETTNFRRAADRYNAIRRP
jgi:hypothetical protein